MAVRLLPPPERERYREEWATEALSLPRVDQAPYAFRLATRAWWLRCELKSRPAFRPARAVVVVGFGTGGWEVLASAGWAGATLCSVGIAAVAWTVSSAARTRRLASLISAARGRHDQDA